MRTPIRRLTIAAIFCPLIPVLFYPLAAMGAFISGGHIWLNEMRWSIVNWTIGCSYAWFFIFAIPMHILLNRHGKTSIEDYVRTGLILGFVSPVIVTIMVDALMLFTGHNVLFIKLTYFSFFVDLFTSGAIVSIFTIPPIALFWFLVRFKS